MSAARAELLKWVGFASMLVDHIARYVHPIPAALWVGRLAFPCFAVAIAVQVRGVDRARVAVRLLTVAALLLPLQWFVVGAPIASVLATLALGLLAAEGLEVASLIGAGVFVAAVACGYIAEYSCGGVLLVAGVAVFKSGAPRLRDLSAAAIVAAAVLLIVRAGVAGAPMTAAGLGLVFAYWLAGGIAVRRVKGIFLPAYVAQWVLVGVCVALFSRRYN